MPLVDTDDRTLGQIAKHVEYDEILKLNINGSTFQ